MNGVYIFFVRNSRTLCCGSVEDFHVDDFNFPTSAYFLSSINSYGGLRPLLRLLSHPS